MEVAAEANRPRPRMVPTHDEAQDGRHEQAGDKPAWTMRRPTAYNATTSRAAVDTAHAQEEVVAEANKPRPREVPMHDEARDGQHEQAGGKPAWTMRCPTAYDPATSRAAADTTHAQDGVVPEASKPRSRDVPMHDGAQDGQRGRVGDKPALTLRCPTGAEPSRWVALRGLLPAHGGEHVRREGEGEDNAPRGQKRVSFADSDADEAPAFEADDGGRRATDVAAELDRVVMAPAKPSKRIKARTNVWAIDVDGVSPQAARGAEYARLLTERRAHATVVVVVASEDVTPAPASPEEVRRALNVNALDQGFEKLHIDAEVPHEASHAAALPRGASVEEREDARSSDMAAQFVRELPAVHVAELLGGEWAARQVPDENDRAAILLTAVKSRGGPGGGTTRLALAALRTLRAAAPPGVEVFPLTVAFAANVKRKVDAAAKLRARGTQGGQTVAVRFQGGLVALQKLGLPVPADSVIVRGSVPLFVPTERAQAATLPLLWACKLQTAAAAELPAHDSPTWLAAWLRRYYARACYAAWVLGLRYKAMQRFTPLLDEVQPLNVLKGRVSMQKDGSPSIVYSAAAGPLGAVGWWGEYVEEHRQAVFTFPDFKAPRGRAGRLADATALAGQYAPDGKARDCLQQVLDVSDAVWRESGCHWHSLHGSLADDARVIATVPVRGSCPIRHDQMRCLGHWRRDARARVDAAAAACDAGVIAQAARDFSVAVGLPGTHGEMLIRYSSGAGRNGDREQHIVARSTVLALLAQGVELLGPGGLGSGSEGVRQVAEALRAEHSSG